MRKRTIGFFCARDSLGLRVRARGVLEFFFRREGRWIARARRLTWVGVVRLDHLLVTVEDLLPEIERKGGGDRSAFGFVGCCQLAEV